ncbi:MAG TPA: hypothetical protein VI298_18080 [Geobacteraceae bacterium]
MKQLRNIRIVRNSAIGLLLLILSATLLPSFHWHADGREHADCAVCKVSKDLNGSGQSSVPRLVVPLLLLIAGCCVFCCGVAPSIFVIPQLGRAPPHAVLSVIIQEPH